MGWFLPKTYLKWREPLLIRRLRKAQEKPLSHRLRLGCVLFIAGLGMSNWGVAKLNGAKNPPPLEFVLPISFAMGFFLIYALPPLTTLLGDYEVRVSEQGISLRIETFCKHWKYREIQLCCIITGGLCEKEVAVLEIIPTDSKPFILGIASSVSLDELQRVLTERGVPVEREGPVQCG